MTELRAQPPLRHPVRVTLYSDEDRKICEWTVGIDSSIEIEVEEIERTFETTIAWISISNP